MTKLADHNRRPLYVAVDFDGTCVDHCYPDVGDDVPYAKEVLRRLVQLGAQLVLFTMRSGKELDDAVQWFSDREIELFGINHNPTQSRWTDSPKAYAHVYVDDAAFGCPLRENPRSGGRPFVDWESVGQKLIEMAEGHE